MLNVKLDTSPLKNGHGGRGIGMYTRMLAAALTKHGEVTLLDDSDQTQKPDLIHYPFFDLFFSTLPIKKTSPTVVTIHDVIPLMFPEYYKPGFKGSARLLKQRLALRSAKAIITDSEFSRQQITRFLGLKPERITVIPLAADPTLTRPTAEIIHKHLETFQLPPTYILYVGDINYNKNVPQLIKLLKFLPDEVQLVCVGANFKPQAIPEWQWIETQMALSNVEERVTFVTNIPVGESEYLAAIYARATAYVQPSLAEGFGLPLLEAMQCETPVVATDTSSLGEVGGDHALYAAPEAEALAEKVKVILGWSTDEREAWVKAAYMWSQKFSWSKVAAQTVAVYEQVAHEK